MRGIKGEKLPTEKELSRQFGVSTVTIREALRGLQSFGFIKKKRGRGGGIFINEPNSDSIKAPLLGFLYSRNFSAKHLGELRLIIEPAVAKIAAVQISSHEISSLERNIQYCENRIEKAGDAFSIDDFIDIEERNIEFHRLIAEATHNPVLALTIDYAMDFLFDFKKAILKPDVRFSIQITSDHRSILSKLIEGDGQMAYEAMFSHIQKVEEYLVMKESQS